MKADANSPAELPAPVTAQSLVHGHERLGLALLLLVTVLAYLNSFTGTWQFDDYAVLLSEPRVQSLQAWWQSLPQLRPLFKLSVAINHQLNAGLLGFHALNLGVHLINVALLFALFRSLPQRYYATPMAAYANLFLCTVFALHPAQTEAVTYLSGRSVALEAMGLLIAACALQRWQLQRQRGWLLVLIGGVLFALGSRESAVIAPLLLAWVGWQYRRDEESALHSAITSRQQWRAIIAALVSAMALLALVLLLPRYRELLWLALQWQGIDTLVASQSQAILHLLKVAFAVAPLNADPALSISPLFSLHGQLALWFVVIGGIVCWRLGRRKPLLRFALGWLVIVWLPTHSIFVRLDPVNDRQLYLALPALALLAFEFVHAVIARWRHPPRALLLLTVALAMTLALATVSRNTVYQTEQAFWQDVLNKTPHNARAWNNLGIALAAAGDVRQSEQAFLQALQLRPGYVRAAINLRLLRAGRPLTRTSGQKEAGP